MKSPTNGYRPKRDAHPHHRDLPQWRPWDGGMVSLARTALRFVHYQVLGAVPPGYPSGDLIHLAPEPLRGLANKSRQTTTWTSPVSPSSPCLSTSTVDCMLGSGQT